MRFTIEQGFDGPLDRVEAAFVDPAYLERLSTLPKLGRPTLVHRVDAGDLVHQWVKYAFVGDLNAAVRRVVDPARLTWVEESTFDRRPHRTTRKTAPDPSRNLRRASATFQLAPDTPERPRRTTEADLKVTVPL